MIHKITLVKDDETEIELGTKPKYVRLETTEDDRLKFEVKWDPRLLAEDAEEYLAVKALWPGKGKVVLSDRSGSTLFSGKISGIVQEKESLGFHARQESLVPGSVKLTVVEDTSDPNRRSVLVTADNFGEGGLGLDFGNGSTGTNVGDGTTQTKYSFPADGTFTITATDVDQPDRTASVEVTVPYTAGNGDLEVSVSADTGEPTRHRASIIADNKGAGEVSVSFGDGAADGTNPGDGVTPTTHDYAPGAYSVVVTDVDEPSRTVTTDVTIPFPAEG